jgi:conjugal transfer ATP-binding protein TraC
MELLTADEVGPRVEDIRKLSSRSPFSDYLPYRAFDEETNDYHNGDNTVGRIWECRPLPFMTGKAHTSLVSVLRQEYPDQTVFQFMLFPDSFVDPILNAYLSLKTRDDPVVLEAAQRYADHLSKGRDGVDKMRGIPTRNFRLFVSVKAPVPGLPLDKIAQIEEGLQAAGLGPQPLKPGALLAFLRRLFNRHVAPDPSGYNTGRYINKQVLNADDPFEEIKGGLSFGGRFAACLTPKSTPELAEPLGMNCMIGGYAGPPDDSTQLKHPFLWTTTVFFRSKVEDIKSKIGILMAQRMGGSYAKTLQRRNIEGDWVLDEMEKEPYCNVITSMWVFGKDLEHLNEGVARARGLWEKQNFDMQREVQIQRMMMIAALPFGLYCGEKWADVALMDRDFQMSVRAAGMLLPIQGDFAGGMKPVMMLVGRKGQIITLDLFDKGASNYNFLCAAGSGSGKSFFTNSLVNNNYGTGSLIRLTDIGYSYKKQCAALGGRYIDVGDESQKLCVNPFQITAAENRDSEDVEGDVIATAYVILTMIYSNTGTANVDETQVTLVKDAVTFAFKRDGGLLGCDHVYEYLSTYPKYAGDVKLTKVIDLAHEMAFNMRDFCSNGLYGKLFNGPSTLRIASDEFVVFELEELQNNPELFRVMSLQVINAVTQDLYLNKDRSVRRFMLFDEAWKYLGAAPDGSRQGASTSLIGKVIEEGYRRARKYGGSTGIVTQSPLDLPSFGPAGRVINGNSAFKFFLESNTYLESIKQGILDYEGLAVDLVTSVKNARPNYSEVLFDTPFGRGVGRLCLDPYNYWVNTTDPAEVARYNVLIEKGLTQIGRAHV